jgi:hypothetical protein
MRRSRFELLQHLSVTLAPMLTWLTAACHAACGFRAMIAQ